MPTGNLKFQPPKGFVVSRDVLSSWQTCLRDVKTSTKAFGMVCKKNEQPDAFFSLPLRCLADEPLGMLCVTRLRAHACERMPAQQRKRKLCLHCPSSANFPDELGRSKRLCGPCAKAAGTWRLLNPCRNCPEGSELSAKHPDAEGTPNRLCGPCAKAAGTWILRNPCRNCPEGFEVSASYPDSEGTHDRLCGPCAKAAGTWILRNPCSNCPEGSELSANHPDAEGTPNRLCGPCAKAAGTWILRNPCSNCPEGFEVSAIYPDAEGNPKRLCSKHAVLAGSLSAHFPGASRMACEFFDRWKRLTGEDIPHVHLAPDQPPKGAEVQGLVPGRRFRPDGYIPERREAWFFHGNWFHGFPPDHEKHNSAVNNGASSKELYAATLGVMELFVQNGYTVKCVWEHEYRLTVGPCPRPLRSVVRDA